MTTYIKQQDIPFDTVTSIIDARRGGSSYDEIIRVYGIDKETVYSVIRASNNKAKEEHEPQQKEQPMPNPTTTWVMPPVHPAAQRLPMMNDTEINELAADIKANGLVEPIVIWVDNKEAANGSDGPFSEWTLDGRGRIEAMRRAGINDPREVRCAGMKKHDGIRKLHALMPSASLGGPIKWIPDTDPELYVLSTNVRRRHLTSEQKREAIAAFLKVMPQESNRKVAKTLGVDHKTVAEVRENKFANGEIPQLRNPMDRVKDIFREDPTISPPAAAEKAGVHKATAYRAKQQLIAAGEITKVHHPKGSRKRTKSHKAKEVNAIVADDIIETLIEKFNKFWPHYGGAMIESSRMPGLIDAFAKLLSVGSLKEVQAAWTRFSPTISSKTYQIRLGN